MESFNYSLNETFLLKNFDIDKEKFKLPINLNTFEKLINNLIKIDASLFSGKSKIETLKSYTTKYENFNLFKIIFTELIDNLTLTKTDTGKLDDLLNKLFGKEVTIRVFLTEINSYYTKDFVYMLEIYFLNLNFYRSYQVKLDYFGKFYSGDLTEKKLSEIVYFEIKESRQFVYDSIQFNTKNINKELNKNFINENIKFGYYLKIVFDRNEKESFYFNDILYETSKYGNIYGREIFLKDNLILINNNEYNFVINLINKIYSLDVLNFVSTRVDKSIQNLFKLSYNDYDQFKNQFEEKLQLSYMTDPRKTLAYLHNFDKINNTFIQKSINPKVNYVEFRDYGDNNSDQILLSLFFDFSNSYNYKRYNNFPTVTTFDMIKGDILSKLPINDPLDNSVFCLGRTIFIKTQNGLEGIKLKKDKEDIRELIKEKRIINWISDHPELKKKFSYLKGNNKNNIEIEEISKLPGWLVIKLNQEIEKSNSGYTIDISNNNYYYITYDINNVSIELSNFMDFINQMYENCKIFDNQTEYNKCIENVEKNLKEKINVSLQAIDFIKYLENCKNDTCSEEMFLKSSIMNLVQVGYLVSEGLVHSSLINMFHNIGHERRFITIANLLDVQAHRRGIGRLSVVFDISKFSNIRILGIADFAEIITLDDLGEKLYKSLQETNRNNYLKLTTNPEKLIELEALQSQFFSWVMVLIRKYFIIDKAYLLDEDNQIELKNKIKKNIREGLIFYLSAYLNKKPSEINSFINSLKLEVNFDIMVNQFLYFLTRKFVDDFSYPDNKVIIEKIYNNKIFQRHTKVTLPFIKNIKPNVFSEYTIDEFVGEISSVNPRGWCTVVLINNEEKPVDYKNMGWFYFISDENPESHQLLVESSELEQLLGYKLHPATSRQVINSFEEKKRAGIVLVINNSQTNETNENIFKNVWERLYPKMDAGPVNGSIPYQELFNIMSTIFINSIIVKTNNLELDKDKINTFMMQNKISSEQNTNNLLNNLFAETIVISDLSAQKFLDSDSSLNKIPRDFGMKFLLNCNIRIEFLLQRIIKATDLNIYSQKIMNIIKNILFLSNLYEIKVNDNKTHYNHNPIFINNNILGLELLIKINKNILDNPNLKNILSKIIILGENYKPMPMNFFKFFGKIQQGKKDEKLIMNKKEAIIISNFVPEKLWNLFLKDPANQLFIDEYSSYLIEQSMNEYLNIKKKNEFDTRLEILKKLI